MDTKRKILKQLAALSRYAESLQKELNQLQAFVERELAFVADKPEPEPDRPFFITQTALTRDEIERPGIIGAATQRRPHRRTV